MAYVPEYEYDVFLSYSRKNNNNPFLKKWVSEFKKDLTDLVDEQTAGNGTFAVFIDETEISGNQATPDRIDEAIDRSAILVLVMSQAYLESKSCQLELVRFFSLETRDSWKPDWPVFVVRYDDVGRRIWPERLKCLNADYKFYITNESYSEPVGRNGEQYQKGMYRLRHDLVNMLKRMRNSNAVVSDAVNSTTLNVDSQQSSQSTKVVSLLATQATPFVEPQDAEDRTTNTFNQTNPDRWVTALFRVGLYGEGILRATEFFEAAKHDANLERQAFWLDRIADGHRPNGDLREAQRCYEDALKAALEAKKQPTSEFTLQGLIAKIGFGQIMVDDFLIHSNFLRAYDKYLDLLLVGDDLMRNAPHETVREVIRTRILHIKRQQAEMLRLLGKYNDAHLLIASVLAEYPDAEFEAKNYARLLGADCQRLSGNVKESLETYEELESLARSRDWQSFLGQVMWRKAGALQLLEDESGLSRCRETLVNIIANHPRAFRFIRIYGRLVQVAGVAASEQEARSILQEARQVGELASDFCSAEHAHSLQCEAEIDRQFGYFDDAKTKFYAAFRLYLRMKFNWGIVRSWIGVHVTDRSPAFSQLQQEQFDSRMPSFEGLDREMLTRFEAGEDVAPGLLSACIP